MTVTGRLSKIWYPVAILMHAVANLAAMLYQTGIIKSIYLVEGITTLVTTAIVLIVYYLYNSTKNAEKTVRIEIASAKKK